MSKFPSMPLFVDDYEAATAHLTVEEDGCYMRLLRLCWRQSDCTIPDDNEWIKRRMRVCNEDFNRIVLPIIEEFFERKNGRVFQGRLTKEHKYVNAKVQRLKKAGSKGGKSKALKNKETTSSDASVLPVAKSKPCSSDAVAPTSTPTPTPNEDTNVSSPPIVPDDFFDQFWEAYPRQRRGNKTKALKAYLRAIKEGRATEQEILDGVNRYAGSSEVANGYAKGAEAWLNDDRWSWDYSGQAGGNGPDGRQQGTSQKIGGTAGAAMRILDRLEREEQQRLRDGGIQSDQDGQGQGDDWL